MRILEPLKRIEGQLVPTTFEDAFQLIYSQIKQNRPEETAVFAGGKLSNEELYLIQKWTRIGIKTNALTSFEYLERHGAFCFDKNDIVPLAELAGTTHCYCLGFDPNTTHPQLQLINQLLTENGIETIYLSEQTDIQDFCAFFKAVNLYIVRNKLMRGIFVERLAKNLEPYLSSLLPYDLSALMQQANIEEDKIKAFVQKFLNAPCPVIIYYEPNTSIETIKELNNLALLTGIQAQQSSGLLGIKENINSQGLFDMGIFPHLNVGGDAFDDDNLKIAKQIYGCEPAHEPVDVQQQLINDKYKTCVIFQEDPLATYSNKQQIKNVLERSFVVLQTDELNETAALADIILPASLPEESEGTYTDSTRVAFTLKKEKDCPVKLTNFEQIAELGRLFGLEKPGNTTDVFFEYVSFFKTGCRSAQRHFFKF